MELEEAIKILNQCTNDWDELCYCVFKDTDEKDYTCIGCREKALEVVLNHITKQEKMIELMAEHIETGCDFDNRMQNTSQIKQYFEKKVEESE